jgi:hypothetical protein
MGGCTVSPDVMYLLISGVSDRTLQGPSIRSAGHLQLHKTRKTATIPFRFCPYQVQGDISRRIQDPVLRSCVSILRPN